MTVGPGQKVKPCGKYASPRRGWFFATASNFRWKNYISSSTFRDFDVPSTFNCHISFNAYSSAESKCSPPSRRLSRASLPLRLLFHHVPPFAFFRVLFGHPAVNWIYASTSFTSEQLLSLLGGCYCSSLPSTFLLSLSLRLPIFSLPVRYAATPPFRLKQEGAKATRSVGAEMVVKLSELGMRRTGSQARRWRRREARREWRAKAEEAFLYFPRADQQLSCISR